MTPSSHGPSASVTSYVVVFVLLMVLTAVTTAVAFEDLGRLNTVVMLAIATTKATVVGVFFMHLRRTPAVARMAAVAGVVWLGLMIGFTLSDVLTRVPQP